MSSLLTPQPTCSLNNNRMSLQQQNSEQKHTAPASESILDCMQSKIKHNERDFQVSAFDFQLHLFF